MKKSLILLSIFLISCSNQESKQEILTEAWARPAQQGGNSAAYFTILNHSSATDTLRSIQSPDAGMTQIHESYETEDGLMGMREAPEIILQPYEQVQFERGGLHIMLMNLKHELQAGDTLKIQMAWTNMGDTLVKIPVRSAPSEVLHNH